MCDFYLLKESKGGRGCTQEQSQKQQKLVTPHQDTKVKTLQLLTCDFMDEVAGQPSVNRALRISQLEANYFSDELYELLRIQLLKVFKFSKSTLVHTLQPEIKAGLKLLLWWFSVNKNGSSLGQAIFQSRYAKTNKDGTISQSPLSHDLKILLCCFGIGLQWIRERWGDLVQLGLNHHLGEKVIKCTKVVELGWELASLVNFVVFLQTGLYSNIVERLLGITHIFDEKQKIRKVDYEFMNRELLWHGFSEFIFFLVPLINFHKLKNAVARIVATSKSKPSEAMPATESSICSVCRERPINMLQSSCGHVFCHYCAQANLIADETFACPDCRWPLQDEVLPESYERR